MGINVGDVIAITDEFAAGLYDLPVGTTLTVTANRGGSMPLAVFIKAEQKVPQVDEDDEPLEPYDEEAFFDYNEVTKVG